MLRSSRRTSHWRGPASAIRRHADCGMGEHIPLFSGVAALEEIDYREFCSMEFESFRFYRQVLKNDPEAAARVLMEELTTLLED